MSGYLQLLRRRPHYRRLWAAELVSSIGDWFSIVAVSVVSLTAPGGGALTLASALAAHLLPQTLAAPWAGFLADRWDQRRLLIGSALFEGVLTLGMALAAALGELLVLQILLCLRSMASAAREPAAGAVLPVLVERGELRQANALGALTWSVAFAVGMSVGGLATALGPEVALLIDAATFGIAALMMWALPRPAPRPLAAAAAPPSAVTDLIAAARAAWSPALRGSVFGFVPVALSSGVGWIALNLAGHSLSLALGAATTVGLLQAVRGVGTGVGPELVRVTKHLPVELATPLAVVLGALGLAWAPSLPWTMIAAFAWGCGSGTAWVLLMTEIQERSPDSMRGRLIALSGLGFSAAMASAAYLTAWWVDSGGAALGGAVSVALATLVGWAWLRPPFAISRVRDPAPTARAARPRWPRPTRAALARGSPPPPPAR